MIPNYVKKTVDDFNLKIDSNYYDNIQKFQNFISIIGGLKIIEDIFEELYSEYLDGFSDLKLETIVYIFEQAVKNKNYELAKSSFNTIFKTLKNFLED